jgi:hypothetical protein
MQSEASVVARKVRDFIVVDNHQPHMQEQVEEKKEPGILRNIALITLMSLSVVSTQITLILVKWTKALDV